MQFFNINIESYIILHPNYSGKVPATGPTEIVATVANMKNGI